MKEGCINLMDKNKKWVRDLGTWFGLGDMPKAPGTFGTLGGVPLFIFLSYIRRFFPNNMVYNSFYFMFLITFFAVAVYVSDICEREIFKKKDPQNVVIDEVLGYLTTLFLINPVGVSQNIKAMVIAFVIFRFFDITKLGPIDKSQHFERGIGVVLDDFLAGIIGNFLMVCIWSIFF